MLVRQEMLFLSLISAQLLSLLFSNQLVFDGNTYYRQAIRRETHIDLFPTVPVVDLPP